MGSQMRVVQPLPARWDGEPVQWSDLSLARGSIDYHFREACEVCGSLTAPWYASGRMQRQPDRLGWSRWAIRFLARRCRDCLHDTVTDEVTGEVWDLGPEDYGPGGSYEVAERDGGA